MTFTTVIGPVKAGKSRALIQRFEDEYASIRLFSAKQAQENGEKIKSRAGGAILNSIPISSMSEILYHLEFPTKPTLILVDEVQFINAEPTILQYILAELGRRDIDLVVYGLDMDYKGMPFATTALCMSMADKVVKVHGTCDICHLAPSTISLRMHNNKPLSLSADVDLVQLDNTGETTYLTVCRDCFNKIYNN